MWPFKAKSLAGALLQTKRIKIDGIIFRIRRISPLDYLAGTAALQGVHDVYKTRGESSEPPETLVKKTRLHYTDVFMAAVVEPKLKRKQDDESGVWVEGLFSDWALANALYSAIFLYTYGKKNFPRSTMPARS